MSQPSPYAHLLDSLSANEFAVEIDGQRAPGILAVQGLVTFKLERTSDAARVVREPVKIVKLVQRDPNLPFSRWIQETIAARADLVRPLRTIAVVALDEGVETRRWTLRGAYITEIDYSNFDTGSSELVQETLTVHFEDLEETWAWNG
jgi:phage tail-like protein